MSDTFDYDYDPEEYEYTYENTTIEYYEHLSTKHLQRIVGYLQKVKKTVPSKVLSILDERIGDMFDIT